VRGKADEELLAGLKKYARELGIPDDRLEFQVSVPWEELQAWLGRASVGMHTMWCEHFGIGVVEMMAAGVLTIAHNSGGPKQDIIVGETGTSVRLFRGAALILVRTFRIPCRNTGRVRGLPLQYLPKENRLCTSATECSPACSHVLRRKF